MLFLLHYKILQYFSACSASTWRYCDISYSSVLWLQVLFLLYHYFEAREVYNAIRVFIAGYVWMTGYGNFLYYYKTKDFSFGR